MDASAFAPGPILVPLDGSELAERALPYATVLAEQLKRSILLMTASRTPEVWNNLPGGGEYDQKARAYCQEYLESVRARLGSSDIRIDVRDGFGRDEILRAAEDCQASLIVAVSHGRSGITRWMYGSIASHLAHQSDRPLLIVGREPLAHPKNVPFQRILVPLDGSQVAEAAIAPAVEIALPAKARVTLVRVVPHVVDALPYVTPSMYLPELDSSLESGATAYLRGVRSRLGSNVTVDDELLRGPAADSLTQFVEEQAIDLVVMTTHARAGLQRALLGSTADRMLQSSAPVLLIRPPE